MATKKRSTMKHAASTMKRKATKAKAGKSAVAKIEKKAKKATRLVKAEKHKAERTAASVRVKAKKLLSKAQHFQHDASDVAARIGTTMETIGDAIVSLVKPDDAAAARRRSAVR